MSIIEPATNRVAGPAVMAYVEQVTLLNSILEGSTEYSIVAKDLNGLIVAWNEGARRIYGYDASEVVGKKSAFILHHPEDVATGRAQAFLDEARKTGKWAGELRRVRKNGTEFWAFVTMTLRSDPSGNPIGFTMISRDLTESQHVLRELKDSQEYNRGLIESNIDALVTTDTLGTISDVNRQMCEMTEYSREELIGSPFKQYFTDSRRAEDGIRRVLSEDRVTNYELVMRGRDGRETVVAFNATTFRSSDGRLKGVFAAARDITDQKGLEEDLRQAQNYNRGLIEASVDALLTVDPNLKITDVNEQTVRTTGYSREELIGSTFPDYFTDPQRASEGVRQTLSQGFVTNYVLVLKSRDGRETLVSFNASVFKDTQGTVRGIFAAARDITEQRRLEDQLRQAQNYTRGLIESSVDAMITVDQDLTITDVNEQMVALTGVAKEALIGSRFDGYFTEPAAAASGVRKTLNEGYVTNYELTLRKPSGGQVLVSFNASIFKDTDAVVRGIFAVARDVTAQRRLEQELREQQNYSRSLIEASVDALVTVDPQGRVTDVNDQMALITGEGRQKLIGSPFAEYFTDPERAAAGVRKTFDEGIVQNYELVVRSRSGAMKQVSFNAAVFRDTSGQVAGIYAAARDVTAQKGLERELREQQTYNRSLIESNVDALMTTDPLGIITDVNRQMCQVTGRTREELIGTAFREYFTDSKRAEDGIRRVLSEGRVTNYELTIRSKNGRETVVSYNATTFTGEEGRLRGVFAAARDITAQKLLEDQLRQAQNYNRGLIESSVDAMLTVGPDLTVTDVNEQMVKLTGYTRDQLVGSSFPEYFTEPNRAEEGVRKTLKDGYVTNYELLLRSRHRREILVSFNASVFRDTAGVVRGIFAVARDVTGGRRLEQQLRESQNYNRGLIESSVDALVTVDPELVITDVNEQMIKLTGAARDELVGSPFKDYFTEPDRAAAGVRLTLAQGSVTNYELVLKSRSGKRTVVSFNAGTFKDTAGQVAGILAAARDITTQKRLEDEVREQQNYNRSLIESSVDALMTVAPNGLITDVNEQTVRLTGYNRKHLIGSQFVEYFTEPDRARAGTRKTFEDGVVTNYELVLRSRSGRKAPVSFNAAVFRDTSGAVVGILAAAREISTQKQIEQALREQQAYTRSLIESNIDALMTTDTLGIITDVNKQMCSITGRQRDELVGTPFKDYFTEPTRAEDGIRKVLAEDRVTNYELTIRSKDGKATVVSYNATTFKDADGRLRGVFAAARDITDQKRLEGQIKDQNRELTDTTTFLNNVLESSTEYSIIAKDLDGTVLAWNEGARRNYGYSAEDMVGKQSSRILHTPEDVRSGRVDALLRTALETGKAEGVFERVRKNGERFTASIAVTLRRGSDGRPVGYVLISKDITDQQRLEEQLRRKNDELEEQNRRVQEANRLKSEFLANMSHELRTPLNGIIGFAELLHDEKVGPVNPEHKEYLGDILTSGRHLLQLINDVLDLAKVEAGKMEFHPDNLDLATTIGEVRDILRTMAGKKRIQVSVTVDPAVSVVETDPAKFKQVLYNYLSNALKFTPDGGRVWIRVSPQGPDSFRLEVEDNGIGIREEDFGRLFGEFQQLDASAAKKYPGTGLGLALTRRIVEAQGGQVGVTSTFGSGSKFFAVLRTGKPTPPRSAPSTDGSATRGQAVLVIDDDSSDRTWLTRTLLDAGFAVDQASNGLQALKLLGARKYAAVTVDLLLPDMAGFQVIAKMRTNGPNKETPAIVVSVIDPKNKSRVLKVHAYLIKPVSQSDLLEALEQAGVSAGDTHQLLLVSNDAASVARAEQALSRNGYAVRVASTARDALSAAASQAPSAVIVDLATPGVGEIDWVRRITGLGASGKMPLVAWASAENGSGASHPGYPLRVPLPRDAQADQQLLAVVNGLASSGVNGTSSS